MLNLITNLTHKIEDRAVRAGFAFRVASGYYRDVIEREATLASITKDDHILCIGGGICPFSAILFHQRTGARVTVIDNNAACIPKAREVIARLGLADFLTVIHQDGDCPDLQFDNFSVIHLALQVSPMERVFARAVAATAPGTRLLIRRPKKYLANIYCPSFTGALDDKPYTTHKSRNIGCTLLYIKQDGELNGDN
ncbi:MAG: class I SAM-dependent methyltransferase [Clostridiales bacterium]|jgi:predicted O-methyltransferase YrrM|nr:class I SAM-dependent methyltransferase [Clostridiales bacterium]